MAKNQGALLAMAAAIAIPVLITQKITESGAWPYVIAITALLGICVLGFYAYRWVRDHERASDPVAYWKARSEQIQKQHDSLPDAPPNTGKHWSEIVSENDARGKPSITRTIVIPESSADDVVATLEASLAETLSRPDFLGLAAAAGSEARAAVSSGDYNKAWALYQDQKSLYLQHAKHSGFTARQTIAIDASIHQQMANVLRLEGRHADALVHILYWAIGTSDRPVKAHESKVRAYFNRCKLKNTTLDDAETFVASSAKSIANFQSIQTQVRRWLEEG